MHFEDASLLLRLCLAMICAGVLGLEREAKNKPAGLRTHVLVGVSGAFFVVLGDLMMARAIEQGIRDLRLDPLVVLSAVVSGVSFLGAGAIFFSNASSRPHGLTTASSLLAVRRRWVVACGIERYALALGATLLYLFALHVLNFVERRVGAPDL
ncbi:MAG: MgtC/SapB family protein [Synechococcales cyanobacterium CRU_2_2]|nr:MgtC/SapB family protein [Synechococcales cyanobacterium CRU_2_2]